MESSIIIVEDKIVSQDINTKLFSCDISKCRGACCIEGDSGAPTDIDEALILEDPNFLLSVFEYLSPEGQLAIKKKGPIYLDKETGTLKITLRKDTACAFVRFENGMATCAIEKAWLNKKITFRKPISCHLYPIRISKINGLDCLNYEQWDICKQACIRGEKKGIRVIDFCKEAIIRKYGTLFYNELKRIFKRTKL